MTRFTMWAGHAVKRSGWRLNPRAALSGLALVSGLALLAAFYLALASQTAVLGRRLQEMEAERVAIMRENAYLRDQIARTASIAELRQRAISAGFVTSGTIVFIPVELSQIPGDVRDASAEASAELRRAVERWATATTLSSPTLPKGD